MNHPKSTKAGCDRGNLVAAARQRANRSAGAARAARRRRVVPAQLPPEGLRYFAPEGWLEQKPELVPLPGRNRAARKQCATHKQALLDWAAAGIVHAAADDEADHSAPTYAACWEGVVIDVHRYAVEVADAVMHLTGDVASEAGLTIQQRRRSEVGLSDDSMVRVITCECTHPFCDAAEPVTLEMSCAAANAAAESSAPHYGFVTPAQAVADEARRHGIRTSRVPDGPLRQALMEMYLTRFGQPVGRREPIDTRDISRDDNGDLLAVRPQPGNRHPTIADTAAFIEAHDNGVATGAVAEHFEVTAAIASLVIADINPDYVAARSAKRCIRVPPDKQPQVWRITADRTEIDASFEESCQLGREIDYDFEIATDPTTGLPVVLSTEIVFRW